MYSRILKRILLFYPTLFVLSIFLFMLKEAAVGDEVLSLCGEEIDVQDQIYQDCVRAYKLDKPSFYISVNPPFVDTEALASVFPEGRRSTFEKLLYACGDWDLVAKFDEQINDQFRQVEGLDADRIIALKSIKSTYFRGIGLDETEGLLERLAQIFPLVDLEGLNKGFEGIKGINPHIWQYRPSIDFHGFDNRFHAWWRSAIVFDFGQSFRGRSVNALIKGSVKYTLILNLIAFILSIITALGFVLFVSARSSKIQQKMDGLSSMLLAIPRFWLATLLIFFFANNILFPHLSFFKIGVSGATEGIFSYFQYLSLPIFCLAFPIVILLYKLLRENINIELQKQYVQAARARGLKEKTIFRSYVLPNAVNPLLTAIGSMFSRLLVGSVIIESIFFIPGLGGLLFDAFMSNDWPVLYALCFISGIMTLVGYIISDILYFLFDPKLRIGGLQNG